MTQPVSSSEQREWRKGIHAAEQLDSHGDRVEFRQLVCTDKLNDDLDWPAVGQVCRIERTRRIGDAESRETSYAITSLSLARANAKRLRLLWRDHWRIENCEHWVRDNTFDEDACQVRSGSAPQFLASLRNLAISIFHKRKVKNIAANLRSNAINPRKCLEALGLKELP